MKKGFTLIELLIVIVILGILAALISGNFLTSLKKGRDAKRKADLEQIQKALETYYEDIGTYPAASAGNILGSQIKDVASGKVYMQLVPTDPLSATTSYGYATDGTYYKLYACLENDQQVLPYISTPPFIFPCTFVCKDKNNNLATCVWGISSGNTTP